MIFGMVFFFNSGLRMVIFHRLDMIIRVIFAGISTFIFDLRI